MNKIRKGDEVVVITGRDKGRRGTVIKVLGEQVLVENMNMVKRHTRPNPQKGIAGRHRREGSTAAPLERAALEPGLRRRATASASVRSPMGGACGISSPTTKSWTRERSHERVQQNRGRLRWQG